MKPGLELAGRYELQERLGQGGMGEVWRCYDQELSRPVAVKVLLSVDAEPELADRFRQEATIAASLQHPGITMVHDIGRHDDRLFIVMELLRGADLATVLASAPKGLPIGQAVSLMVQAAEALASAHARHIVHRDIKPANLFLVTGGPLKICDFGIAKALDASSTLTVTGRIFGTPAYMAPEQWTGEQVDDRVDLYALGCVLHALLTGRPPFAENQPPFALMREHLDKTPRGPRDLRPEVPVDLDKLVLDLLAKEPRYRPSTAGFVASTLTAVQLQHQGRTNLNWHYAATLDCDGGMVFGLAMSPNGRTLASGHIDHTVRLWDTGTRRCTATLTGHTVGVGGVAFSPDGHNLVSGSTDETIRLWSLATGQTTRVLNNRKEVDAVAFSPDGRVLAGGGGFYGSNSILRLWNVATGRTTATLMGHVGGIKGVAFSPDGRTLASAGYEGTVRLWDASTGEPSATFTHDHPVIGVAFSPDGRTLASASHDRTVRLWDVSTGQAVAVLRGDSGFCTVVFSPDGRIIAGGGGLDSGTVRLWDVATGTVVATLTGHHTNTVTCLAFSPDGRTLASGSWDGTVRLWEASAN